MTLPYERTRAVLQTREFLQSLVANETAPKVFRDQAHQLLRHYPSLMDLEQANRLEERGAIGMAGPVFAASADDSL